MVEIKQAEEDEVEIDLKELLKELWMRKWWIFLSAIVVAVAVFTYISLTEVPTYTSTGKMYILEKNRSTSQVDSGSLSTTTQLLNDFEYLIHSDKVASQVLNELDVGNISTEWLNSVIHLSIPDESRVLFISATTTDPKLSKQVADAVMDVSAEEIEELMGIDGVNIIDYSKPGNRIPSSKWKYTAIAFGIGALAAIAGFVIFSICDTRVRSGEDIAKYLDIPAIGNIPLYQAGKRAPRQKRGGKKGRER